MNEARYAPILAELRARLRKAKDLSEVLELFHDQLAVDPAFLSLGSAHDDPRLAHVIEEIVRGHVGQPLGSRLRFLRLASARFLHCGFPVRVIDARGSHLLSGIVIYFEDDDRGLFALAGDDRPTFMARFQILPSAPFGIRSSVGLA